MSEIKFEEKNCTKELELLTKEDVCAILKCELKTLNNYIYSKQIPYIPIGREIMFKPTSIAKWQENREIQPNIKSL